MGFQPAQTELTFVKSTEAPSLLSCIEIKSYRDHSHLSWRCLKVLASNFLQNISCVAWKAVIGSIPFQVWVSWPCWSQRRKQSLPGPAGEPPGGWVWFRRRRRRRRRQRRRWSVWIWFWCFGNLLTWNFPWLKFGLSVKKSKKFLIL